MRRLLMCLVVIFGFPCLCLAQDAILRVEAERAEQAFNEAQAAEANALLALQNAKKFAAEKRKEAMEEAERHAKEAQYVTALEADNTALLRKEKDLQDEIASKKASLASAIATRRELDKKWLAAKKERDRLQTMSDKLQTPATTALSKAKDDLQKAASAFNEHLRKVEKPLHEEVALLEKKLHADLEIPRNSVERDWKYKKGHLEILRVNVDVATDAANAAEEAVKAAEEEVQAATQRLFDTQKDLASKKAIVAASGFSGNADSLQSQIDTLRTSIEEEVKNRVDNDASIRTDLGTLNDRVANAEQGLSSVINTQKDIANVLRSHDTTLEAHEKRLADAEAAIVQLRTDLDSLKQSCLQLPLSKENADILAQQLGIADIRMKLVQTTGNVDSEQNILLTLQQQIATLKEKLEKQQKPRKDLFVVRRTQRQAYDRCGRQICYSSYVYVPLEQAFE